MRRLRMSCQLPDEVLLARIIVSTMTSADRLGRRQNALVRGACLDRAVGHEQGEDAGAEPTGNRARSDPPRMQKTSRSMTNTRARRTGSR